MGTPFKLLFALAAPFSVSATFRVQCSRLALANMDPIVANGTRSGHQHDIIGSLGFDVQIDEATQRAALSTCDIVGDFSNYWMPSVNQTIVVDGVQTSAALTAHLQVVYYIFGPFQMVTVGDFVTAVGLNAYFQAVYYQFDINDIPNLNASVLTTEPIAMVLGDASGLATTTPHINVYCVQNNNSIFILAKNPGGWNDSFIKCTDVVLDYNFPSCWNGGAYQPDQSHTAYLNWYANGTKACPDTHPYMFPQPRIQYNYKTLDQKPVSWSKGNAPFALSSGNGSIQSAHADALLLWDETVLQTLINSCYYREPNDCGPLADIGVKTRSTAACKARARTYVVPDEYK